MASIQSGAVAKLYRTWLANPAEDEAIRDRRDWDVLTAEPGGADYLETDAGGVPAMWAVPKGCAEDRVLLCIHGGGYISGSMFTHRKLFAHLAKAAGARARGDEAAIGSRRLHRFLFAGRRVYLGGEVLRMT